MPTFLLMHNANPLQERTPAPPPWREIRQGGRPQQLGALAESMKDEPSPGGPLGLAMEDYVQRRAPGWAVIGGPFFENEKLPASVEEQRKDFDQRIKGYADHAKAFFAARRKR